MKELLNKDNIVLAKHNPRGHYEHLKEQAKAMLKRDIAYINIARVLGISEQIVANILNVPERY